MSRVLIVGCGDVGTRLGIALAAEGHEVFGVRRDPAGLPASIHGVAADVTEPRSLDALPGGIDLVAYTAAAGRRDAGRYRAVYRDGLRHVVDVLVRRGEPVQRLLFTSSTAVYGVDDGSEVDESTTALPGTEAGEVLLEAEQVAHDAPFGAVVLRLAGIYGPGRTRLVDDVRAGATCNEPDRWTNRIHADDAASAAAHLLSAPTVDPVYIGVDDLPVPRCEVLRWLAAQVGGPPPLVVPGRVHGERRGGSKRLSNARLRASGWRPRFPTYRDGYAALLAG